RAGVCIFRFSRAGVRDLSGNESGEAGSGRSHSLRITRNLWSRYMKRRGVLSVVVSIWCLVGAISAVGQTFPTGDYFKTFFVRPSQTAKRSLSGPVALEDYIKDGKLRLSLNDAIRLTLLNNTDVQINRIQNDLATFSVLKSKSPFDPVITTSYN